MLERFNEEIKRRTRVVRIFPNEQACIRLVSALAMEENENWNYYGEKLFKLFDLNNPEQWEKCILFLKEYYSLRKIYSYNKELGLPEAYEIC